MLVKMKANFVEGKEFLKTSNFFQTHDLFMKQERMMNEWLNAWMLDKSKGEDKGGVQCKQKHKKI